MWYQTNTGQIAAGGKVHLLRKTRHTICGTGGVRIALGKYRMPPVVTCKKCLCRYPYERATKALEVKFDESEFEAITNKDGQTKSFDGWLDYLWNEVKYWIDSTDDPLQRAEQVDTTLHVFMLSFGIENY